MNLTKNEKIAIRACLNYDSREAQLSDNYSNGDPDSIRNQFLHEGIKFSKHQVAGVIGSLINKGAAFVDKSYNGNDWADCKYSPNDIVWLTDNGVNAYFDLVDAGKEME